MTVDELVRGVVVAVLAPTLGQDRLFVRLHHRKPPDLPKITGEAGFGRRAPISSRQPTHDSTNLQDTYKLQNKIIGIDRHCQFDFETLLSC
jgi:hypothetical protein